jgi:hypothetical protein
VSHPHPSRITAAEQTHCKTFILFFTTTTLSLNILLKKEGERYDARPKEKLMRL